MACWLRGPRFSIKYPVDAIVVSLIKKIYSHCSSLPSCINGILTGFRWLRPKSEKDHHIIIHETWSVLWALVLLSIRFTHANSRAPMWYKVILYWCSALLCHCMYNIHDVPYISNKDLPNCTSEVSLEFYQPQ